MDRIPIHTLCYVDKVSGLSGVTFEVVREESWGDSERIGTNGIHYVRLEVVSHDETVSELTKRCYPIGDRFSIPRESLTPKSVYYPKLDRRVL